MASVQENSKAFIIKLFFPAPDDSSQPQIRRVKLARIVDDQGKVSYANLIQLASKFFSENEVSEFEIDSISLGGDVSTIGSLRSCVALEYLDEDGDTITLTSTEELLDAIDQFSDKQLLRLTVRMAFLPQRSVVSRLSSHGTASNGAACSIGNVQTESATIAVSGASASGDTGVIPQKREAPAASTADTGKIATVVPGTVAPPRASPDASADSFEKQISGMVDAVVTAVAQAVVNFEEGLDGIPKRINEKREASAAVKRFVPPSCADDKMKNVDGKTAMPSSKIAGEQEDRPAENSLPFIHGRHTCDSCLISPIIGTRYHAVNRVDYDLCARCYTNYQGEDIKFEPTEDDRDIGFQSRWQDRRREEEKAAAAGFDPEPASGDTTSADAPPARPFIHGRHTCDNCLATPIVGKRYHAINRVNYDVCEACYDSGKLSDIRFETAEDARDRAFQFRWHRRRNLVNARNGYGRRNFPKCKASGNAVSKQEDDPALMEAIRRSLEDTGLNANVAKSPSTEDKEVVAPAVAPPAGNIEETPSVQPSAPMEEEIAVDNKEADSSAPNGDDSFVGNAPEKSSSEEGADAVDRVRVASTQLKDPPVYHVTPERNQPITVLSRGAETSSPSRLPEARDHSFESDAEGSGDVAEALGATFDKVASVIDAMLHDADLGYKESLKESASMEDQWSIVDEPDNAAKAEPNDAEEVVRSDDEDDGIARAAEMIGSSLFNSEISSHSERNENGVTDEQRGRWETQLSQLRELGFGDEAKCVEIMERIKAAYIGSEMWDEEVSVTQVVNELLKES